MKVFIDSADMLELDKFRGQFDGITTNPTLMRQARVENYKNWAKILLDKFHCPVSFEVTEDNLGYMFRQAKEIASWGEDVYVKIPVTNTQGESSVELIKSLGNIGVKVNVTAVMTEDQLSKVISARPKIISIFAGRIADTGIDPHFLVYQASYLRPPGCEILWASAREVFNIEQAKKAGADIITLSPSILAKRELYGKDLTEFSLDTVRQFYGDAQKAGYQI